MKRLAALALWAVFAFSFTTHGFAHAVADAGCASCSVGQARHAPEPSPEVLPGARGFDSLTAPAVERVRSADLRAKPGRSPPL